MYRAAPVQPLTYVRESRVTTYLSLLMHRKSMSALLSPAVDLGLAQVAVAHGIYDFVDKRIQELDSQLVEFDKELAAERERLGIEPVRGSPPSRCGVARRRPALPVHVCRRCEWLCLREACCCQFDTGTALPQLLQTPKHTSAALRSHRWNAVHGVAELNMPTHRAGTSRTPSTRRAATRSFQAAAEGGAAAAAGAPGAEALHQRPPRVQFQLSLRSPKLRCRSCRRPPVRLTADTPVML